MQATADTGAVKIQSALISLQCSAEERGVTTTTTKLKPYGLSPRANYTDRATAACRRSD
jgi:hypothetical protein